MKTTTFLAFGCVHVPLIDKAAEAWLLKRIAEYKPDVIVHLGDGHEADSASRWPSEYDWDLTDEFEEHNAFLARIREAYGGGRRVFLPGNHDSNILSIGRISKKVRRQCDYRDKDNEPELAKHWEQPVDYEYDRNKGVFRMGQVSFAHGWETSLSSDEFHALKLGMPFGLHVQAHTHRPTPMIGRARRTLKVLLPYWFANTGCIRNLKPEYAKRFDTSQWGQGLVMGEAAEVKSPRMSRQWDAVTEIFKLGVDVDFDGKQLQADRLKKMRGW